MESKSKEMMAKAYALGDDGKVKYVGLRRVSAEGQKRLAELIEERKRNPEIRPMSDADIMAFCAGITRRGGNVTRKMAVASHA